VRAKALLENAVEGAKRGASLTQRMLAFARRQDLQQQFSVCLSLWGIVADRIGQRNLLIIACTLLAVLAYFSLDALTSASFTSFLITNVIGCALTAMTSAVISTDQLRPLPLPCGSQNQPDSSTAGCNRQS
jgi:MFS family permease